MNKLIYTLIIVLIQYNLNAKILAANTNRITIYKEKLYKYDFFNKNNISDNINKHIVKAKETIYSIGKKYNLTKDKILKLNPKLNNNTKISIGDTIILKEHSNKNNQYDTSKNNISDNINKHIVKAKETIYSIGKKYNLTKDKILKLNPKLNNNTKISIGDTIILKEHSNKNNQYDTSKNNISDNINKHIVKAKETIYSIVKKYNLTKDKNKDDKKLNDSSTNILEKKPYINNDIIYKQKPIKRIVILTNKSDNSYSIIKGIKYGLSDLDINNKQSIEIKILNYDKDKIKFIEDNVNNNLTYATLFILNDEELKQIYPYINKYKNKIFISCLSNNINIKYPNNTIIVNPPDEIILNKLSDKILKEYNNDNQIYIITDNDNIEKSEIIKTNLYYHTYKYPSIINLDKNIEYYNDIQNNNNKNKILILVSDKNQTAQEYVSLTKNLNKNKIYLYGIDNKFIYNYRLMSNNTKEFYFLHKNLEGIPNKKSNNISKCKNKYEILGIDISHNILKIIVNTEKKYILDLLLKINKTGIYNKFEFEKYKTKNFIINKGLWKVKKNSTGGETRTHTPYRY